MTAAFVCITILLHAGEWYHDSLLQGQTEKRCIFALVHAYCSICRRSWYQKEARNDFVL